MSAKPRLRSLSPRVATGDHRTSKPGPKVVAPFYLTPEWRSLMLRLIDERGRRCQQCGLTNCRIFGDHIVELKDGGTSLDPDNVLLLCGSCHTRKTVGARAARMAEPLLPPGERR